MNVQSISTQNDKSFGNAIVIKSKYVGHTSMMGGVIRDIMDLKKVKLDRIPEDFFQDGSMGILVTDGEERTLLRKIDMRAIKKFKANKLFSTSLRDHAVKEIASEAEQIELDDIHNPGVLHLKEHNGKSVKTIVDAVKSFIKSMNREWGRSA